MDLIRVETAFRPTQDGKCAVARGGMVSSAFPLASRAGAAMLQKGDNAVDAAEAAAITPCVCEPQACGLGRQMMVPTGKHGSKLDLLSVLRDPQKGGETGDFHE